MELKEVVSISGLGGLFKVIAQRPDGLIVQNFDEDRSKFVSNRSHMFTPLDGITVYTEDDHAELTEVFKNMKKLEKEHPPVSHKSSKDELKAYFTKVLPNYDEEQVYVSDIKKIIKWYGILNENGLLTLEEKDDKNKDEEGKKEDTPAKDDPAKDQPSTDEEE